MEQKRLADHPVDEELIAAPEPSGLPPIHEVLSGLSVDAIIPDDTGVTEALRTTIPELCAVEVTSVTVNEHVPARLYRSPGSAAGRPLLLWAHGGAFLGGSLDMGEAHWVGLSVAARGVDVLSADYRKAVDGVTYPTPYEDLLAAWNWALTEIPALGSRTVHVGGASAGASLAVSVALRLRDDGLVQPASLVLAYPTVHRTLPPWPLSAIEGIREKAGSTYFSAQWIEDMATNYLGSGGTDAGRYAFPGEADLAGLPPHQILLAEFDTLRSSGQLFADSLVASGVEVELVLIPDSLHGFLNDPTSTGGAEAPSRIASWITRGS